MTYADLAFALGMAESSVKRMLSRGDMPLSRIDEICRAIKLDFAELAKRVADMQPLLSSLTEAQEKALVADKKLLLVHGSISPGLAPSFMDRMQRVAQDFAQQHQADQKLDAKNREGYTLLLAMRSWEFEAFAALRR